MTKTLNPLTNSTRNTVLIDYREKLTPHPPKTPRRLLKILKKNSGRNNRGIITTRHQGGRHKRKYRFIERIAKGSPGNPYRKDGIEGEVMAIKYDPNRNCFNALTHYPQDNSLALILAPENLNVGDKIISGERENIPIKSGNNLPLRYIPKGTPIHNLESRPGEGGKYLRSAGTYGEIIGEVVKKGKEYRLVKLISKEVKLFLADCRATIGRVGNSEANLVKLGKAGRSRWRGIRPTVRGSAMNPNDHPHGGGEQKAGIGHPSPLSPWGKKTLGKKTRKKNKPSNKYIVQRRK
ncbi:MAG: 50S ribosomal protein L2 [Candidatus Moeniiplasma glomeromycotorum]|nr:50S ribosomal protein L2 [Candidatus Moeniiplasma glomeromycotorum]